MVYATASETIMQKRQGNEIEDILGPVWSWFPT